MMPSDSLLDSHFASHLLGTNEHRLSINSDAANSGNKNREGISGD